LTRIFDCILFNDELDVLEHRLRALGGVVSTFVIVEATTTFQGAAKPLQFAENRMRFADWRSQMRHVVMELAESQSAWERERQQHSAFEANLQDAADDDLVLVGDCDEVPLASVVERLAAAPGPPTRIHMRNAVYWANTVRPQNWTDGTMAFRWRDRGDASLEVVLGRPGAVWGSVADPASISDGGWHLGDLNDVAGIASKLRSFSHTELSDPRFLATAHLERCRSFGVDYRSSDVLEFLPAAAIPKEVRSIAEIDPLFIRPERFPALPLRMLYATFSASRRRLPRRMVAWADRNIVLFLALFGLPIFAAEQGLRPLWRALRQGSARGVVTRDDVPRLLRHRAFCLLGLRKPIIQLTTVEQEAISRWAMGRKHAVELGVAEGGSAYLIANALDEGGSLSAVDPFFPGVIRVVGLHELIARRLLRRASANVRFIKQLSWEAAMDFPARSVDFLFVDADHSEEGVRRDWAAWSPRLTSDAVVVFHDAVDPATGEPGPYGPGFLVRDLLARGWHCVETAGAIAVIGRSPNE
jgi:beta-1,4-mannosyl-glycoprotein beta-1,4-N-acetylglucosaminyltransferase